MSEMVDRIAAALKASIEASEENFSEAGVARLYEAAARRAIETMRAATWEMQMAADKAGLDGAIVFEDDGVTLTVTPGLIWAAMIDEALREKSDAV
jgi:hypothetical protein